MNAAISTDQNTDGQSRPGRHPVLVVGGGPAGISAALALRAAGRPATVLERRVEGAVRPGSRAAYLHGSSLRLLDDLSPGLGREVADNGLMWATKRSSWAGREVFTRTYPPITGDRLPPFTSLPQVRTEDLMIAAARSAGVRFCHGVEITGVRSGPSGVTLTDSAGTRWEADYVIAADGSRSVIRSGCGIDLEGPRSANVFVVVDVADDPAHPVPRERIFHYRHPRVGGRNVLIVPFAGGWRIDLNLYVRDDPERFVSAEGLRQWIGQVMPAAYGDRVTWVSQYRFAQQVAQQFTDAHRRILLTGEASHLFAPFGARGMNSSIPDAVQAARAVLHALTFPDESSTAVGRFADERRRAALYNRACAEAALDHMLAHRPGVWARRRLAATVAQAGLRAGAWLDSAPYGPALQAKAAARTSY